ncbi:hypothetical protein ACW9UR_04445 [Halovulum sp. GXIMD14794]
MALPKRLQARVAPPEPRRPLPPAALWRNRTRMTWLVILGTITTLIGLAGLAVCIRRAAAVKGEPDQEKVKRQLHGLVALNLASVGVAGLGLAFVVVGLFL